MKTRMLYDEQDFQTRKVKKKNPLVYMLHKTCYNSNLLHPVQCLWEKVTKL